MSLELLGKAYSQEKFELFIEQIFDVEPIDTRFKSEGLTKQHLEHIDSYKFIGRTRLSDKSRLGFFVFKSKSENIEKKRVGFNAIIPSLTKKHIITHALVAIYHEKSEVWRLSYVSFDIKDGKQSLNTSVKRYTYELGEDIPIKTAKSQIGLLLNSSSITKILLEEVFSVEKLSNEFFKEYKQLYHKLVEDILLVIKKNRAEIQKESKEVLDDKPKIKSYIKKMLGRIVFLYFVQKKGWLNNDKKFLSNLFFAHVKDDVNFYDKILEQLFINGLNKKRDKDIMVFDDIEYIIPYLNGGLFDADDEDKLDISIPNDDLKQVFELFDSYNFTIIEDTPHDSEVAIDPEMLGRIFEDLLEDRKDKGAFYTPREIVHYMCQQSIKNYLESRPKEQTELEYIQKIKILDPAIGSGAFPMGMLHEITEMRVNLGDKKDIATIKRETIQNSIYGVDIEPSAVEIAKLRFWLSIVVDEVTPTPLPNLAYKIMVGNSLLQTLNGFDPLVQNQNKKAQKEIRQLQSKFHDYFNESDVKKKEKIDAEVKENINLIFQKTLKNFDIQPRLEMDKKEQKQYKNDVENYMFISKILKEYIKDNYTTELFFYKIYFREVVVDNKGFDVVIGNPPYVRHEKIKELKPKLEAEGYKSYNGTADLYIYFFEQGYNLLKENGVLSYITSNKYTRAKYGKQFREFVLKNATILEYIDFNGVKVFESATVDTSILSYKKSNSKKSSFIYCDINSKYKKESELEKFVAQNGFEYLQSDLSVDSFSFSSPEELSVKKRIEKVGTPLKEWDIKINYGIKTGFNEAFIIDGKTKDKLIEQDAKSVEIIKPLLRGRDIKKYNYEFSDKWLINTHNGLKKINLKSININNYPIIKKHLNQYYDKLKKRGDKGDTPYNLRNCAYLNEFEKEKIIYPDMGNLNFCFDNKNIYFNNTVYFLNSSSKYILAILNSKLISYYYNFISSTLGNGGNRAFKIFIEQLPIPKIPKKQQKPFEILVDYIIFAKEQNMNLEASLFESVIDGMVYDLYFEEEMKRGDCFISDEVRDIVQPWSETTSTNVKKHFVTLAYEAFKESKTTQRGLIYSRTIPEIKVINGVENDQ